MFKKIAFTVLTVTLGASLGSSLSYGQSKTTTVEETTTRTTTPRTTKKVTPASTTTTSNTTVTTTKEAEPRQPLTEDTLKKMSKTLCTKGFKSYVGNDNKNICQGKATAPDIAYSCVWKEKGVAVYAPTEQGPCSLDYAEHQGSIIITKNDYKSNPPLKYGVEAQCCFRAAKGPSTTNTQ